MAETATQILTMLKPCDVGFCSELELATEPNDGLEYVLTQADLGARIHFKYIPVNMAGTAGEARTSTTGRVMQGTCLLTRYESCPNGVFSALARAFSSPFVNRRFPALGGLFSWLLVLSAL